VELVLAVVVAGCLPFPVYPIEERIIKTTIEIKIKPIKHMRNLSV
jgi:hypothetical protein